MLDQLWAAMFSSNGRLGKQRPAGSRPGESRPVSRFARRRRRPRPQELPPRPRVPHKPLQRPAPRGKMEGTLRRRGPAAKPGNRDGGNGRCRLETRSGITGEAGRCGGKDTAPQWPVFLMRTGLGRGEGRLKCEYTQVPLRAQGVGSQPWQYLRGRPSQAGRGLEGRRDAFSIWPNARVLS